MSVPQLVHPEELRMNEDKMTLRPGTGLDGAFYRKLAGDPENKEKYLAYLKKIGMSDEDYREMKALVDRADPWRGEY